MTGFLPFFSWVTRNVSGKLVLSAPFKISLSYLLLHEGKVLMKVGSYGNFDVWLSIGLFHSRNLIESFWKGPNTLVGEFSWPFYPYSHVYNFVSSSNTVWLQSLENIWFHLILFVWNFYMWQIVPLRSNITNTSIWLTISAFYSFFYYNHIVLVTLYIQSSRECIEPWTHAL